LTIDDTGVIDWEASGPYEVLRFPAEGRLVIRHRFLQKSVELGMKKDCTYTVENPWCEHTATLYDGCSTRTVIKCEFRDPEMFNYDGKALASPSKSVPVVDRGAASHCPPIQDAFERPQHHESSHVDGDKSGQKRKLESLDDSEDEKAQP